MSATLVRTTLMDGSWSRPIDKVRDIVGMDGLGLNLLLEVRATSASAFPKELEVKVETKEPHRGLRAKSSTPEPLTFSVPRFGQTATYRLEVPASVLSSKVIPEGQREFATVVRADDPKMHATADAGFRAPLLEAGWSWRGMGRQGRRAASPSGDLARKIPDAKQLMLAGGVELMEISVVRQPGLVLRDPKTWAFLRSPADVFFYTGHGYLGNLVTHAGSSPDGHDEWLKPEALIAAWDAREPIFGRSLFDLDVLIINGCSVLSQEYSVSPGHRWARLLKGREGPLHALLGYRAGAPSDARGGHAVAVDMARRIAGSLGTDWPRYATAWLEVNRENDAKYPAGTSSYTLANACAIDPTGYWTLDRNLKIVRDPPLGSGTR